MELSNLDAIEIVKKEAVKMFKKPLEKITPEEADQVWYTFVDERLECSLVGRIDDENEVWFMIENEGRTYSDGFNYEELKREFNSLVLMKTFQAKTN